MSGNVSSTVGIFAAAVSMMALKPIMIHFTRGADAVALPPQLFLLEVEAVKMVFCMTALALRRALGYAAPVWRGFSHTSRFTAPAVIYLVMNAVTVITARRLEPATFQLVANTKILATAAASYILMAKSLSRTQWFSLLLLTIGVTLGQWPASVGHSNGASHDNGNGGVVMLMLLNSCMSAFGGVQAERALKAPEGSCLSIFANNLHMSSHTLVVNVAFLVAQAAWGGPRLWPTIPSLTAVAALASEALNGILVSLLMREAGSIVKNYAFSLSSFVVAAMSFFIFGHVPARLFYVGAIFVVISTVLYTAPPLAVRKFVEFRWFHLASSKQLMAADQAAAAADSTSVVRAAPGTAPPARRRESNGHAVKGSVAERRCVRGVGNSNEQIIK